MRIAIIGAGFSGLLAAYLLKKKGVEVTVYERAERPGGHCMTFDDGSSYWELGTVCSCSNPLKELLIDLGVDYSERFVYKHFIDGGFNRTEHMSHEEVSLLLSELETLKKIIETYSDSLELPYYRYIHQDLLKPFDEFIDAWKLPALRKFILPFLTSFGFGDIHSVQAFYILKIFSLDIINGYLQGRKMLFFKNGTSHLISRLSGKTGDMRFAHEVNRVEAVEGGVIVETPFSSDQFDKVLVTAKLGDNVIKTSPYKSFMEKIETNPFFSCAYEVTDCDAVTTYFKGNQGKEGKIQLFRITSTANRKVLVAYCNGYLNQRVIEGITEDIKALDINVRHLILAKQWQLFPHLKMKHLLSDSYSDIGADRKDSPICMIGSLVTIPTLDNLYFSIRQSIEDIMDNRGVV